jgi:hypothetical protein
MEEPAANASAERAGEPQAASAATSAASPPAAGGESHLRLLHAALSVADATRREAERDNAQLRGELAVLQEHLARLLARAAAARAEVADAGENCDVNLPPPDAGARLTPPVRLDADERGCAAAAPEARLALVPAPRPDAVVRVSEAEDASDAREELLRRRAAALGLAGSKLFPKAMNRA